MLDDELLNYRELPKCVLVISCISLGLSSPSLAGRQGTEEIIKCASLLFLYSQGKKITLIQLTIQIKPEGKMAQV